MLAGKTGFPSTRAEVIRSDVVGEKKERSQKYIAGPLVSPPQETDIKKNKGNHFYRTSQQVFSVYYTKYNLKADTSTEKPCCLSRIYRIPITPAAAQTALFRMDSWTTL